MLSQNSLSEDHVYHEISDRLLSQLDLILMTPDSVLVVGLHTQRAEKQLQDRYPNAVIHYISHFSEIKNHQPNSFNLIIAQFPLLYDAEPMQWLYAFYHLLSDEGLLLFSSLGPDSLIELRRSFASVDRYPHMQTFSDMHDVGDWMRSLHFADPVMHREVITLAYDDVNLLFDELKAVGITNLHPQRFLGLTTQKKWQRMLMYYEQFKMEGCFPVTLEVVYGHGWKIKSLQDNENVSNEIVISLDKIQRKK